MESYVKVYNIRKLIEIFNLNDGDLSDNSFRNSCITRYEREINHYGYKYFDYQSLLMGIRESHFPYDVEGTPFNLIITIK